MRVCLFIHTHTHVSVIIHTHMCVSTHSHTHMCVSSFTHPCVCVNSSTHTCVCPLIHTHVCRAHLYIFTFIHTCASHLTCVSTHSHTRMSCIPVCLWIHTHITSLLHFRSDVCVYTFTHTPHALCIFVCLLVHTHITLCVFSFAPTPHAVCIYIYIYIYLSIYSHTHHVTTTLHASNLMCASTHSLICAHTRVSCISIYLHIHTHMCRAHVYVYVSTHTSRLYPITYLGNTRCSVLQRWKVCCREIQNSRTHHIAAPVYIFTYASNLSVP